MGAKESAVAKSTGRQKSMLPADRTFLKMLALKKKVSKQSARYYIQQRTTRDSSCVRCKFNLGDEQKCHLVRGKVDNERGLSKYYSPKGVGMLPGDIVWEHVKSTGKKLAYDDGHVIKKGAPGFQCKDCKYYLYSRNCLIIEGRFAPRMSCGFIVKLRSGTKI
jgi:hypothetical protein